MIMEEQLMERLDVALEERRTKYIRIRMYVVFRSSRLRLDPWRRLEPGQDQILNHWISKQTRNAASHMTWMLVPDQVHMMRFHREPIMHPSLRCSHFWMSRWTMVAATGGAVLGTCGRGQLGRRSDQRSKQWYTQVATRAASIHCRLHAVCDFSPGATSHGTVQLE